MYGVKFSVFSSAFYEFASGAIPTAFTTRNATMADYYDEYQYDQGDEGGDEVSVENEYYNAKGEFAQPSYFFIGKSN